LNQLGCSPAAIYNYYADKDELIAASTAAAFAKLGTQFRKIKKSSNIADKIRKMGKLYVQSGLSNPEGYVIAFTVPVAGSRSKPDTPHGDLPCRRARYRRRSGVGRVVRIAI
jgi:AcrR family transcriptional regulator